MTTDQIKDYLLKNPIDRSQDYPYKQASDQLGIDQEVVRGVWRSLRRRGLVEQDIVHNNVKRSEVWDRAVAASEFSTSGDKAEVKRNVRTEVKTLEDLIAVCEIDTKAWDIIGWKCRKWDLGIKNGEGLAQKEQLFSVSAQLKKKVVSQDLGLQKDVILSELKEYLQSKPNRFEGAPAFEVTKPLLLELALFDMHFGKLSHEEESGEDYDIKIAVQRYRTAIIDLLSKVDLTHIGRILLPIGNDMFNVDNINKTTSNGTPQDTDTRFHKMVKTVREVLVDVIDYLATLAPVDVLVVPGNHDVVMSFMCGEILDAFYHSHPNVTIDNAAKLRKYYSFGKNSFMFTHGDREKQADLGLIFASEEPKLWGNTVFRFCQIGHYHHNKKINYISTNEFQGFQVQILPSLSPNDAWHSGKGYSAIRQAKAFIFDEEEGLVAELTHTAKTK